MIFAKEILTKAMLDEYIASRIREGKHPTFANFCSQMGFARSHSWRVFSAVNGFAPGPYITSKKDEYIKANVHRRADRVAVDLGMSKAQVSRRAKAMGLRMGGK